MQDNNNQGLALFFAFLGQAIFGFSFIFTKQAMSFTTLYVLLAARFTVAFLILNCILLTGKFKVNLKGKNIKLLLLLCFFQPVIYFICENYGVKLMATSYVGLIMSLVPVASLVLGFLLLKERVGFFQVLCTFASVAGVLIISLGQPAGSFSLIGFILLLGAVFAASMYSVLSRKISGEFTVFERTYVMFALGCVTFVSVALIQCRSDIPGMLLAPLSNGGFWISVLFLAGASSVGAFLMLNYAFTYLNIANVILFANISTVISILAGIVFLKESFGLYQIIGSVIILVGVYGISKQRGTRRLKQNLCEESKLELES